MRRRTNKQNEKGDTDAAVTPLDEDEQEQIVQALQEAASRNQEQIHAVFTFVCVLMAAASMAVVLLDAQEWQYVLAHAVYAAILHMIASRNTTTTGLSQDYFWLSLLPVLIPLVPIYLGSQDGSNMEHHVALVVGNLFTTGCSILLRRDADSTLQALRDLESSKYRYKSL